jgi:hypothetical protein
VHRRSKSTLLCDSPPLTDKANSTSINGWSKYPWPDYNRSLPLPLPILERFPPLSILSMDNRCREQIAWAISASGCVEFIPRGRFSHSEPSYLIIACMFTVRPLLLLAQAAVIDALAGEWYHVVNLVIPLDLPFGVRLLRRPRPLHLLPQVLTLHLINSKQFFDPQRLGRCPSPAQRSPQSVALPWALVDFLEAQIAPGSDCTLSDSFHLRIPS